MKENRPSDGNIDDDPNMEGFCEWLYVNHQPFSMTEDQMKWVWYQGMAQWHAQKLRQPELSSGLYLHHAETLKQCLDMASTLKPNP